LLSVIFRPSREKTLLDRLPDLRGEHELLPQHLCNHVARAVIAGGPEPARRDHDIGPLPALAKLLRDRLGLVRQSHIALQQRPSPTQLRTDEGEVSVGREAEEKFIP
jgi:hypothetical protein